MKVEFTLNEAFYIAKLLANQADEKQKYLLSLGIDIAPFEEITKLNMDLQTTRHLFEKMFEAMNKAVKDNEQRRND